MTTEAGYILEIQELKHKLEELCQRMVSTLDQTKAFDELTEEIQKYARTMSHRCTCCGAGTDEFLRLYLCDTHMKKYEEILTIEEK